MVSLDSSVSLPAETEVEYEPVTVTVTSPLPETTVLPFATMVTVLPSLPEATLSAEMVVSFATPPRGRAVDIHSDGGVARRARAGAGRRVVRDRRRVGVEIKLSVLQHHIGGRVGEVEHRP